MTSTVTDIAHFDIALLAGKLVAPSTFARSTLTWTIAIGRDRKIAALNTGGSFGTGAGMVSPRGPQPHIDLPIRRHVRGSSRAPMLAAR